MIVHIALLFIILLLNFITENPERRKKYTLPFSFFLVFVYWAFRYDYGLDYWNYYRIFEGEQNLTETGFGEFLFLKFLGLFSSYYQVIIAHSAIIIISLYHLVKKYVPEKCYWLFFLLFFIIPNLHFNLISAMRSSLAACVMYWAFDLCVISKKRWLLFLLLVFVGSNIHTSTMVFFLTPLLYYGFSSLSGKSIFIVLIVANILSTFMTKNIYSYSFSFFEYFNSYERYVDSVATSNFMGFLYKSVWLLPAYYLCEFYDKWKTNSEFKDICIISYVFLIFFLLGLDFQWRLSIVTMPFFIIALTIVYNDLSSEKKKIMTWPFIIYLIYGMVGYYTQMYARINGVWSDGNTYYYSTIFNAGIF